MMSKTNEEAKKDPILFPFPFILFIFSSSLDWQTFYLLTGRKGRRFWNWFLCPNSASPVEFVWKSSSLKSRQGILCPSKILEISFNFSTLPSFQHKDGSGKISREYNVQMCHHLYKKKSLSEAEYFFEVAEAVFVGWFSFEYVIRFVAAPHKFL